MPSASVPRTAQRLPTELMPVMLTGTDSCPPTATGLPRSPQPLLQASAPGVYVLGEMLRLMWRRMLKVGAHDVRLVNMPASVEDLHGLKPFEFQNWVVDRINGIQAGRKSGDMGVDGHTFFLHEPVQIKQSEAVGRNVIDNFETAVKRDGKTRGFVIAFSFGRGAHEEASRVRREGLDIQLITVSDLLDRLDEVQVQMGATSPSGDLPGMEVLPMPEIDSKRRSADELVRSAKTSGPER